MKTVLYILTAVLLLFSSCIKNKTITIEGRLMQSCDTPAANREGSIIAADGLLTGPGEILFFTSDENGYFKASYTVKANIVSFGVSVQGSGEVLRVNHLEGDKKDLGEVYVNPFPTNFIIKLDVQNPYTENDTLVLSDYSSTGPFDVRLIAGPFESGILDSVFNHMFSKFPVNFFQLNDNSGPFYSTPFLIRSLPYYIGDHKTGDFHISPICSDEFAEVTLVID